MQKAVVKWVVGEEFEAVGPSGHMVRVDSTQEKRTGPGPMELILLALGSCTATDVAEILRKKRLRLAGLEVEVSGERAVDPPRVWKKIKLLYRVRGSNAEGGPMPEKAVKDAVELSMGKYCSVAAMVKKTAEMLWTWEIS